MPKNEMNFDLGPDTLSKLKGRDIRLLTEMFTSFNPQLAKICSANQLFSENAEEVIHQTWETFFVNIEKFEGRSSLRTFVSGILFNKIREHRRARAKVIYEDDSEKVFANTFSIEGWWKKESPSPQKILELKLTGEAILDCVDGLSEQQRTAFFLREIENDHAESICETLGVTLVHLRVVLFRAKDKLRKCLEGKEYV